MSATPDIDPPKPRLRLQRFVIKIGPNALRTESWSVATSNVWQLIGVVDELSQFEGVTVIRDVNLLNPSTPVSEFTQYFVFCDPNTPAGSVLMYVATSIANEAEQEAAHLARNDPNEADFLAMQRDWLWPLRRTLQLGGKLKEYAGGPDGLEQPSSRPIPE